MSFPGFTAPASLGRYAGGLRAAGAAPSPAAEVVPARPCCSACDNACDDCFDCLDSGKPRSQCFACRWCFNCLRWCSHSC